jgi:hypothetical protein
MPRLRIRTSCGTVWRVRISFHAGRAASGSTVSNVCGRSPGPGTLCTRVPGSSVTSSGAPGAVSRVKARGVAAAAPGSSS